MALPVQTGPATLPQETGLTGGQRRSGGAAGDGFALLLAGTAGEAGPTAAGTATGAGAATPPAVNPQGKPGTSSATPAASGRRPLVSGAMPWDALADAAIEAGQMAASLMAPQMLAGPPATTTLPADASAQVEAEASLLSPDASATTPAAIISAGTLAAALPAAPVPGQPAASMAGPATMVEAGSTVPPADRPVASGPALAMAPPTEAGSGEPTALPQSQPTAAPAPGPMAPSDTGAGTTPAPDPALTAAQAMAGSPAAGQPPATVTAIGAKPAAAPPATAFMEAPAAEPAEPPATLPAANPAQAAAARAEAGVVAAQAAPEAAEQAAAPALGIAAAEQAEPAAASRMRGGDQRPRARIAARGETLPTIEPARAAATPASQLPAEGLRSSATGAAAGTDMPGPAQVLSADAGSVPPAAATAPAADQPRPTTSPALAAGTTAADRPAEPSFTVPHHQAVEAGHQVALRVARAAASGVETVSVDLRPPELGRVEVRLTFREGVVQVAMTAERVETFDALREQRASLEQQLAQAGIDLGSGGLDLRHGGLSRDAQEEQAPAFAVATASPAEEAEADAPARRVVSDSLIDIMA